MNALVVFDDGHDATFQDVEGTYIYLDPADNDFSLVRESDPRKVISIPELLEAAEKAGILDSLSDYKNDQVEKS